MTLCIACGNYDKGCKAGRPTKYHHGGKYSHSGDVSVSGSGDETVCIGFVPWVDTGSGGAIDYTDAKKYRSEIRARRRSRHRKLVVCQFCGYNVCRCASRVGFV